MIKKTTVEGYTLIRVHPRVGEVERWAVYSKDIHYGYITKVVYKVHISGESVVFWLCSVYLKVGWKRFTEYKVSNTRKEAVLTLTTMGAKMSGYFDKNYHFNGKDKNDKS